MLHTKTVRQDTLSLLRELQQSDELNQCPLAGGTALALQIGHRISIDLDFFSANAIDFNQVKDLFNSYEQSLELSESKSILVWSINGIKVDVVKYNYPLLSTPQIKDGIRLYSLEDIAAMKLEAIKGRGRKRDFYDLHHLLKKFDLKEMLAFNEVKFKSTNSFMILKSLTFFDDAENDPDVIVPDNVEGISWEKVKEHLTNTIKEQLQQ